MASDVMAGLWPLRLRSLHAGFCAGERVIACMSRQLSPPPLRQLLLSISAVQNKVTCRVSNQAQTRQDMKPVTQCAIIPLNIRGGNFMPKTTLTVTSTDSQNIDDLIAAVTQKLDQTGYGFLAIAFAQELAYHQSNADKLALIKEYVTIQ